MLWKLSFLLLCLMSVIHVRCVYIYCSPEISKSPFDLISEYVRAQIMIEPRNAEAKTRSITYPKEDRSRPSSHEYHPVYKATTTESPPSTPPPKPSQLPKLDSSFEKFSAKLYQIMSKTFPNDNLIYSPISLQSQLTLLYLGASQRTAEQLQTALELPSSVSQISEEYDAIAMETQNQSTNFQLDFAQKIYFKSLFELHTKFEDDTKRILNSEIDSISFESGLNAADEINQWVAGKTHRRIKNIVSSDSLNADTEVVLVNAIYLKAKWAKEFSKIDTIKQEFYIPNQTDPILVDMMYSDDEYLYGDFPEFDAKVVDLPFLNSELSMLVILPNREDGLASMESKLKDCNFNELLNRMTNTPVTLRMPKFQIESDLNMEEPLKMLGIHDIFTGDANFGKMFSRKDVKISEIKHKAFIDVNEGGIEAAAASFMQLVPLSLEPNMEYFNVEYPFMFAIRSPKSVYLIGHVINNFQ